MRYFNHFIAANFLVASLLFKSWPLGACAVAVVAVMAIKEIYESMFASKRETRLEAQLKLALDENLKMKEEVLKLANSVGAMNYKVQQMASYVGAPNE